MHYAEIQDEKGNVLWHGRFENSRKGLESILQKMRKIEESNSDRIGGVFMNPTGNYHVPVKYFLEKNGFSGLVYLVDARRTVHLRNQIPRMPTCLHPLHFMTRSIWRGLDTFEILFQNSQGNVI